VVALLGEAARFFYTAKADKSDRGPGNNHPTVKPVDLMRYLVRLVCPIGGVVLDPFSGSGTTLAAAQAEGCLAIGVEREAAYCEIIKGRFHQRRLF
jgi:site-specific DNA-methyltransferase (adenine-specific)